MQDGRTLDKPSILKSQIIWNKYTYAQLHEYDIDGMIIDYARIWNRYTYTSGNIS